ncbi:coiled-coil domain-containing protein 171 isoform X1 [Hippocampus comes]|uniref:coiled-coil domain-containing protein 171 isoform X1 n=1 Tax=Hippocampus comes TaxID=109280 RepID=UPI00094EA45A|nr:PREDICTED: coiled-coil domain-containing protein 171 isoform X1 [Hippocampus comes]
MQDKPKEPRRATGQGVEKASPRHYAPQQPAGDVAKEERVGDIVKLSFDNKLTGRRRLHQLEKEKLEMMSTHNQQLCTLEAELTRLRASVENGEAKRAELQYQVTVSRRDAQQACESNEALKEQAASLRKVLDMTQQARQEERLTLQQEVDERDALIDGLTSESEHLHKLLQRQKEALEEAQRRVIALQKEWEEEVQGHKSLEADMEVERAAHLEFKRKCEVTQAVLAVERRGQQEAQCNLELLRGELRDVKRSYQEERESNQFTEQALQSLKTEYKQYKCDLSIALETEKRNTANLAEKLEEEKRQHGNTRLLLEQVLKREMHCEKLLEEINQALQQHTHQEAKDDGKKSPPADIMQLLRLTLSRQEVAEKQVQDLLLTCERLDEEKQTLKCVAAHQKQCLQEACQLSLKLQEQATRLQEESRDWSVQNEELQKQSKAHLSFLHCVYQRLMAGCVLAEPQSMLGTFTWSNLCDLINELVGQLTSDLQEANNKVACLQAACEKKSGHLHQLQRRHKLMLAHVRERGKRRAEAWNSRHTRTVAQLRDLLLRSRRKSASFLSACALLAGTMAHAQRRLSRLAEEKHILGSRLAAREELEEELRRLACALGGDGGERKTQGSSARRRWRKYMCVVSALRWWRAIGRRSMELFRLEMGQAGPVVCVASSTLMGGEDVEHRDALCARWLRSKRLSSTILACMAGLSPPACSPTHVRSAARSGLARLLNHIVSPSESAPEILREMIPQTLPPSDLKMLVSRLQQHFLLLTQRLHSAEVERRSLRLQVAHLRRTEYSREDNCRTVPAKHFHSMCSNLRQALTGEQEARALLQEQSVQRDALQLRVNTHATEREQAHRALRRMAEALAEARRGLRGKERSLRNLGKHLSRVDKERRCLEGRLRHFQDATRITIGSGKAATQRHKAVSNFSTSGAFKELPNPGSESREGHHPGQRSPING